MQDQLPRPRGDCDLRRTRLVPTKRHLPAINLGGPSGISRICPHKSPRDTRGEINGDRVQARL